MEKFDVLFLSAHPDDAEFAAGGTLIKLSRRCKVMNVILTHGEAGTFGDPKVREQEAMCAASKGGYGHKFLDIRDNFVEDNAQTAHRIAQLIRDLSPRVVFAPYHTNPTHHHDGTSHPDHLALGNLARKAVRFAKFKNAKLEGEPHNVSRLVYYLLPIHMKPSFVVDVSKTIDELKGLWRCHETQLSIMGGKIEELLLCHRKHTGYINRLDYAEGFVVEEPLVLEEDEICRLV